MEFSQSLPTELRHSWALEARLEDPVELSWSSSNPSTTPSDVDSAESYSTYQDSPLSETPVETPLTPLGCNDGYFSRVRDDEAAVVAVMGIGYVGLHLVHAFSRHYKVIAFDVSEKRLTAVADELSLNSNISLTSNPSQLITATHFLVAVPTPLIANTAQIDTSIIQNALETISDHVRPGATIVVESSVSVGMTRSLLGKMVETHNLHAGMSPERVDPGRIDPPYESIPKIISGLDEQSLEAIQKLYSPVFQNIIPVSSPEVAEMTKLYENCQRMMCIAYANEMADACYSLSTPIDPFEVSRAAATKPFGYLPFTPSAGVGGHCIPVNPNYLFSTSEYPLLQHATEKMKTRPAMLADRTMKILTTKEKNAAPKDGKQKYEVLVVGVAFKPGQELTTNSPGLGIINHLLDTWDAHVVYADPLVQETALPYVPRLDEKLEWNKERLGQFDAIFVVMKQTGLDFEVLEGLEGVLVEQYCS